MNSLKFLLLGAVIGICALISYALISENKPPSFSYECFAESGMALVQGGTFTMGAGAIYSEETPSVKTTVGSFYMSRHEVTNAEFAEFVQATGYVTVAETSSSPEDYPGIDPDLLRPGSAVFVSLPEAVEAATFLNWWHFIEGDNWQHPEGKGSDIKGKDQYPVVHIAYADAQAYAKWKGSRLPTEAEFEYTSRGGLEGAKYAKGNSLMQDSKHIANTHQGLFPFNDDAEDGFAGLAPVRCYPQNNYGIYDLIGNVWEWTKSTFYPNHIDPENPTANLPRQGYAPNQRGIAVDVIKGGSYLCTDDFCMRYRPAARQAQDTGLGTSHIGFRTVKDL